MNESDVFRRILGALEAADIPYMMTGSFASSYHGAPRATYDIDVVIAPTRQQLSRLIALLPATEYYVEQQAALEALNRESIFNVIDLATGWKIDLIVRKSRPFSRTEFDRRVQVEVEGIPVALASAEDVVISKLEWAKLGESQRQIDDVAGILRLRADRLQLDYVERWVRELGLEEQWQAARRRAGL